jgi:hypothetical protein
MTRCLLFVSLLAACGDGFTPTLDDPWKPATRPWDPDCATGCEEILELTDGHMGDVKILGDLDRDDPMWQWAGCFAESVVCWDGGGRLPDCVAAAPCPEPCRAEYARVAAGAAGLEAEAAAFEQVFLLPTAPCGPPDEVSP